MNTIQKTRGFTLIELIIAVTIIVILAGLAIPNYRGHVLRSNRSDAKAALLHVAAAQEKFYMQNNTYTSDLTALNVSTSSTSQHYDLAVTGADANGYLATATPASATEGQGMDEECTSFSVDQQGNRTATGSVTEPSVHCWR